MLTSDPADALVLANQRVRRLREQAAAEHVRPRPSTRRIFAASLRRAADRLDPVPLVQRPA